MSPRLPLLGLCVYLFAFTAPASAQDGQRIRSSLEGKRVTLKIDMPATADGVDVYPGTSRPIDFSKYGDRLKKYGAALKSGETALITKVKIKDDLIEVQLNGGGYGTFGDALNDWAQTNGAGSGMAQQAKKANDRTERLSAGSRFNLRYPNGATPDEFTPAAVAKALEEYATLPATSSSTGGEERQQDTRIVQSPEPAASTSMQVRKGMSIDEVERLVGRPTSSTMNNQVLTNHYKWQDGVLEADFFNGVLVGYRLSS